MGNCVGLGDESNPSAVVSVTKWSHNAYNLIDEKQKSDSILSQKISSSCRVIEAGDKILIKPATDKGEDILSITYFSKKYWVYQRKDNTDLWVLAKNYLDNHNKVTQRLSLNTIIKIGRYKFQVTEIVKSNEQKLQGDNDEGLRTNGPEKEVTIDPSLVSQNCSRDRQCRICFGSKSTNDNPLMESPCKCIGSVKLLHTECLQKWLISKITLKNTSSIKSYHWDKFACDICKETYPDIILSPNGQQLNIINIDKPKTSYILLESIPENDITDKCNSSINCRYFFYFAGEWRGSKVRKT